MSKFTLLEEIDKWVIPLREREVTLLLIDYAFRFVMWQSNDDDISITIETDFVFNRPSDPNHRISLSANWPLSVMPVLEILHEKVVDVVIFKDGNLAVTLRNNQQILVSPDPNHEAWNVAGSGGLLVVCGPGGKITRWSSDSD